LVKPDPFTTRVNPLPPALTVEGERLFIEGATAWLEVIGIGASHNRHANTMTRRQITAFLVRLNISNPRSKYVSYAQGSDT
jgi:hypothetical protein